MALLRRSRRRGRRLGRAALKLRSGATLEAPDAGELPRWVPVVVVGREVLPCGLHRALVAAPGEERSPLGWVSTRHRKDGSELLLQVVEAEL